MVGVDRIQEILGDKPVRDYLDGEPLHRAMREEVDWVNQVRWFALTVGGTISRAGVLG